MRLNVFKGAASLVNAEDFIGRCKVSLDELSEVRGHAQCKGRPAQTAHARHNIM